MEAHLLKDQEAVRRAFLGELQADTPEYNLVDWLNQSLAVPAMLVERYLHYKDLGSQANQMRLACYKDAENAWLANNYFVPIGVFYWGMDQYCWASACRALEAEHLEEHGRESSPDVIQAAFEGLLGQAIANLHAEASALSPEFSLDIEEAKQALIKDEAKRQAAIAAHNEHARRIDNPRDGALQRLPEVIKGDYEIPLIALSRAHKNVAFCAEFSRLMLD